MIGLRRRRARRGPGCLPLLLAVALVVGVYYGVTSARCPAPADHGAGGAAAAAAGPVGPFADPALAPSVREEASTYLTFPEWYIVYSAQDYSAALANAPPSAYPYWPSVGQYWCSYHVVAQWAQRRYPFSFDNHLMLAVIGVSYTGEYGLKGLYEATVGRATEWLSAGGDTDEDRFNARLWRDYGASLDEEVWYDFPFWDRLGALWRETSLWGPHPIRKWERKLVLSAEYAVKSGYAWLIGTAARSMYSDYDETTLTWTDTLPPGTAVAGARSVRSVDSSSELVALPRFREFDRAVVGLARAGVRFRAFAGNDEVLLTAIAPAAWIVGRVEGEGAQLLFEQAALTDASLKRIALNVPVAALHRVLPALEAEGVRLEHLYDY
ncbi:MAG TPA: hypothetical protein VFX49_20690 [Chloroflexota bacterium]|nr:hypothetical protein [Chloroflexota bacterium]